MVVLVILLGLFIIMTIHPYVTYPLSLIFIRKYRGIKTLKTGEPPRSYAILCCVYNELHVIEDKINNLYALQKRLPNCEIFVHSDFSSDGTDDVLRQHSHAIKLSFAERRSGKSVGMNALMRNTSAEVVIFTDANVMVDPDNINNLSRYFQDPEVGCVTGHLRYTNPSESSTAWTGSRYWQFEEQLKQLESDTGSVVGADGSIFAIRSHLYTPAPHDIIDDFHTSMSIYNSNYRIVRADNVTAAERAATVRNHEIGRKIRISCRAFNCHRLLWKQITRQSAFSIYCYVSHKLLRWLSGYFIVAGTICLAFITLLTVGPEMLAITVALGTLGIVFIWRSRLPAISAIWEGVVAIAATAIGVYKSLRGQRFQTWTIASSTRK